MKNLKITTDVSIKKALQLIKKNGAKALIVVDKNIKLPNLEFTIKVEKLINPI